MQIQSRDSNKRLESGRSGRRTRETARLLLLLLPSIAFFVACSGEPAATPRVVNDASKRSLPAGDVVGYIGTYGSHVWEGLPFAEAPVDDLRFRSPLPARPWSGTRAAIAFGSPCPQFASPFAGIVDQEPGTFAGEEDCLYLNVYAPVMTPEQVPVAGNRLPVMFWIHGGGNTVGHASFYDGGNLAARQNVIIVSINYRLGPLGWFRHDSLRADARDVAEASGNFGNLDQIQALKWVRTNISAFGGDPDNVTIFGESAGGRDVIALLLSPLAEGLFDRAIIQSGSAREMPGPVSENFVDDAEPGLQNGGNEVIVRLLVQADLASDRAEGKQLLSSMSSAAIAAFLRATSPEDLYKVYSLEDVEQLADVPNVYADGVVLPSEPPLERFASGEWNRVPVMLGTNRDENKTFLFANPDYVTRWFGLLPRLSNEAPYNAEAAVLTNAWKVAGADAPAEAMKRSGWNDVFVYRWDWDEEPSILGADLGVMIGAGHGFEIPFIFGHYDLGPQGNIVWTDENLPGREELSGRMMSYWTQFALVGDPGRGRDGSQPEWKRWRTAGQAEPAYLVFDTSAGGGTRMTTGLLTPKIVVAQAENDPNLGDPEVGCRVARSLQDSFQGISGLAASLDARCVPAVASE